MPHHPAGQSLDDPVTEVLRYIRTHPSRAVPCFCWFACLFLGSHPHPIPSHPILPTSLTSLSLSPPPVPVTDRSPSPPARQRGYHDLGPVDSFILVKGGAKRPSWCTVTPSRAAAASIIYLHTASSNPRRSRVLSCLAVIKPPG